MPGPTACPFPRVRGRPGGASAQDTARRRFGARRSAPLAEAAAASARVARRLRGAIPVGGVRRGEARVHDLDFLVVGRGPAALRALARGDPRVLAVYRWGERRVGAVVAAGGRRYLADFFFARPSERPFALFHFTGDRAYNIRTRALAKRRGWRLNQYGLFLAARPGARPRRAPGAAAVRTERDLAALLGVRWRAPAERRRSARG